MAVLLDEKKEELIVTCECGCEDAIHIKISDDGDDEIFYLTYMNGNWYKEQEDGALQCIKRKLKKIWRIIKNKDHHYSEICMTKIDFDTYKEFVNRF